MQPIHGVTRESSDHLTSLRLSWIRCTATKGFSVSTAADTIPEQTMHFTPDPYTAPNQYGKAMLGRQRFACWLPLASCIALCLLTSAGNAYSQSQGRGKHDCLFIFVAFLPMCFAAVSAQLFAMHKQIRLLQSQIQSMQSSSSD